MCSISNRPVCSALNTTKLQPSYIVCAHLRSDCEKTALMKITLRNQAGQNLSILPRKKKKKNLSKLLKGSFIFSSICPLSYLYQHSLFGWGIVRGVLGTNFDANMQLNCNIETIKGVIKERREKGSDLVVSRGYRACRRRGQRLGGGGAHAGPEPRDRRRRW